MDHQVAGEDQKVSGSKRQESVAEVKEIARDLDNKEEEEEAVAQG